MPTHKHRRQTHYQLIKTLQQRYEIKKYCHPNSLQGNKKDNIGYKNKILLKDNSTKNMSLERIGQKSGFISNSNFYKIFKDVTGLTASQWARKFGNNKV